jgi:PKD repeat protein
MKKITRLFCASLAMIAFAGNALAQTPNFCHTDEMVRRSLDANPVLKREYLAEQARLEAVDREAFKSGYAENTTREMEMPPVYIIPVVFHVLHQNGPENISDAQIQDEVRILNEDYRKLNPDISAVVPSFTGVTADCEIEFRLAKKDPSGNCTNGIDRIFSALTNSADDGSKLNPWPRNKYLNVWVVKTIGTAGVAGYAYLPGTAFPTSTDGILILSNYIGSIGSGNPATSRALTHEIGHFLNLQHTWGNTNNPGVACGNDGVSDTPDTKGHTTCALTDATCTAGVVENVQNFMEYSYCSNMFTAGQKTRMRAALNSTSGQRSSLWTSANLTATGVSTPSVLCLADFQTDNTTNTVCQGNFLTFTDLSWNGNPTSWSWTFPGGTPSTSTDSVPVIQYNTPGIYDVTLVVSNASGSVNATKTGYVTVNGNTADFNGSIYQESFEASSTVPSADWIVRNQSPGGNAWVQTSAAGATGSKSVMITNLSTYSTYVDELIGPSIDMTAIAGTAPTMTFKTAFAQRTSTDADKLQLYVSTNCGLSWTLRKSMTGAVLTSGGVVSGSYVPTATQWVTQTANLAGYATQSNLYFMFRFTSDGGNNIYIDDINISGTTGISDDETGNGFSIYPNPINEQTVVGFSLASRQDVTVKVLDVTGREIIHVFSGSLSEGDHQFAIGTQSKLSAGIYFVKLSMNGKESTKKLIVN